MKTSREQFPTLDSCTFLDTAFCGLIHPDVDDAVAKVDNEYRQHPQDFRIKWFFERKQEIRRQAADLIGADGTDLALLPNFSTGINLLSVNLPVSKVMLIHDDYPSLSFPFEYGKHEVCYSKKCSTTKVDLAGLEEELKQEKPRILAVSYVHYNSGLVMDIEAIANICKRLNIRFVVDGTQGLSVLPMEFKEWGIDAYITSGYKWLWGGYGTGFMAVKPDFLNEMEMQTASNNNVVFDEVGFHYEAGISNFELGHTDHITLTRMSTAISLVEEYGRTKLVEDIKALMTYFERGLNNINLTPVGGFDMPRQNILCIPYQKKYEEALEKHNVRCSVRGSSIRFSVHAYNSSNDIDQAIEALATVVS
ncbi:MAG: aminotransferase class V-fold PLP-dependent enzyme [Flavobacteriales bacterium]